MSSPDLAPDDKKEKPTATSISCLPNELLLRVLAHLDGASLVRCARVCSLWREVVALVLKHGHVVWEMVCQTEIDSEVLDELLSHRSAGQVPGQPEAPKIDWFAVYKRWYCTRAVSKFPHVVRRARSTFGSPVTCVKATGDLVVTGHKNGDVLYWHGYSGHILIEYPGQGLAINDIALVDPHGCVARPWFGGVEVLHSVLLYSTDKAYIEAFQLEAEPRHVSKLQTGYPVTSMRVCGNLLATLSEERCAVYVLKLLFKDRELVKVRALLREPNYLGVCSWIGISEDSVTNMGPKWMAGSFSLADNKWEKWPLPPVPSCGPVRVSQALIQRKGLLIISTANAGLYVSVDSGRRGMWPVRGLSRWNSQATALALCGTLLAVGLESGRLCLYRLRDKSGLSDLEYKEQPDWTEQLSCNALVSVDISSSPLTMMRPVVVTCSREALFTVHWPFKDSPGT